MSKFWGSRGPKTFWRVCFFLSPLPHLPGESGWSNRSSPLREVNESEGALDVTSSDTANLLGLQMRGSDNVRRGQVPLIKITMAKIAGLSCAEGRPLCP